MLINRSRNSYPRCAEVLDRSAAGTVLPEERRVPDVEGIENLVESLRRPIENVFGIVCLVALAGSPLDHRSGGRIGSVEVSMELLEQEFDIVDALPLAAFRAGPRCRA